MENDPYLSRLPKIRLGCMANLNSAFGYLPEYSATYPTGVEPGKKWKRHDGAYDPSCDKPIWLIGAYEAIPDDPDRCKITMSRVLVRVPALTNAMVCMPPEARLGDGLDWCLEVVGYSPKVIKNFWMGDGSVILNFRSVKDAVAFRMVAGDFGFAAA
jgi:hypothetical protein